MVIYLIITFQNQENFICISKTCTVRFFGDRYNKKSINISYAALAIYVSFMFKCNLHLRLSVLKSQAALFLNRKRISASQSEKLMNSIILSRGTKDVVCVQLACCFYRRGYWHQQFLTLAHCKASWFLQIPVEIIDLDQTDLSPLYFLLAFHFLHREQRVVF